MQTSLNILVDDVLRVVNSFLDYRSTSALKRTCKRMNTLLEYHFDTDEYTSYNPHFKGEYPLLIKDFQERVISSNIVEGTCTNCGEIKTINNYGNVDIESEIENHEKFKRLKLSDIAIENIVLCQFSNLKLIHLYNVDSVFIHFPKNLETLALERCELEELVLPKNLTYLLLDTVDIDTIEINDNLNVIHVCDSYIGMEGDPKLTVFIAVRSRFYNFQTIYNLELELLIMVSVRNIELEQVTAKKMYLEDVENITLESYDKELTREEANEFKIE